MSIVLLDSSPNSISITWPEVAGAQRYVLQFRRRNDENYETLSDKLTSTQARKRNLVDDEAHNGFIFRVHAVLSNGEESPWVTHDIPFHLLTDDKNRMEAPKVSLGGSNEALHISWSSQSGASGYELQMRENIGGGDWKTIAASLSGTEVRKKNLSSRNGYQFRVRLAGNADIPFSPPSEPAVALGLSDGMKRLFRTLENGELLSHRPNQKTVSLADGLGGKEFILLYASAHWCGPCRQFTPMLSKWYHSLGPNRSVEVVFLSADHDENGFKSYYSEMPWLAIDYDDDTREQLMSHIRVSGIPRLAVLDGRTGKIIEDNAVGTDLDIKRWRMLASK